MSARSAKDHHIIAIGDLFRDYWWALLALVALIALALERRLQDPVVRTRIDQRLLALPLFEAEDRTLLSYLLDAAEKWVTAAQHPESIQG